MIRQATVCDLEVLASLFDAYRQFYRQAPDVGGARRFLLERFAYNQSIIFIAERGGDAVGFTQLYPSFSSASMARIFVLNDLYVDPGARRSGAGASLMKAAAVYAKQVGAVRLALSTEVTNETAQSLYERLGWQRDNVFFHYTLPL